MRIIDSDWDKVRPLHEVDDRFSLFEMTDQLELDKFYSEEPDDVIIRQTRSYYINEENDKIYKMHGNLVKDNKCYLCDTCTHCTILHKSAKRLRSMPKYAVANKYDFGDWKKQPNLLELSFAEMIVICRVHTFMHVIKLIIRSPEDRVDTSSSSSSSSSSSRDEPAQKAITGHVIALEHEENRVLRDNTSLPVQNFTDILMVALVGVNENVNSVVGINRFALERRRFLLRPEISKFLEVRAKNVENWLKYLKVVNYMYKHVVIPEFTNQLTTVLESIPNDILDNAVKINKKEDLIRESAAISSIARIGDDDDAGISSVCLSVPPSRDLVATEAANAKNLLNLMTDPEKAGEKGVYNAIDITGEDEVAEVGETLSEEKEEEEIRRDEEEIRRDEEKEREEKEKKEKETREGRRSFINVGIQTTAMNEFTSNDIILYGRYPYLFLLGEGVEGCGTMKSAYVKHILNQYTGKFAKSTDLVFLLFNQQQRHAAAKGVTSRLKGDPQTMQNLADMYNNPKFKEELTYAVENPNTREGKFLYNKLNKMMRLSGAAVPWGAIERTQTLSKMYALSHYFGLYTYFVTISPADAHNAFIIRISNTILGVKVNEEDDIEIEVPLIDSENADNTISYSDRIRILCENPVAQAEMYKRLIDAVCTHLFGIPPSHQTKQNLPIMSLRKIGLFGKMMAFCLVTEAQGRGTPHGHTVAVTEMTPKMLRSHVDNPVVFQKLIRRVDSIVRCFWDHDNPSKEDLPSLFCLSCNICPRPGTVEYNRRWCAVVRTTNVHKHCPTCHKGKVGKCKCRMGYTMHSFDGTTQFREIDIISQQTFNAETKKQEIVTKLAARRR